MFVWVTLATKIQHVTSLARTEHGLVYESKVIKKFDNFICHFHMVVNWVDNMYSVSFFIWVVILGFLDRNVLYLWIPLSKWNASAFYIGNIFMGSTWGPPGSCRPQMGPMLSPWTLLSGIISPCYYGNINAREVVGSRLLKACIPCTYAILVRLSLHWLYNGSRI